MTPLAIPQTTASRYDEYKLAKCGEEGKSQKSCVYTERPGGPESKMEATKTCNTEYKSTKEQ